MYTTLIAYILVWCVRVVYTITHGTTRGTWYTLCTILVVVPYSTRTDPLLLQVVADQLKLEKQREAELDLLYQEEAAKIWEKREAEWEREHRARERLMQEVN